MGTWYTTYIVFVLHLVDSIILIAQLLSPNIKEILQVIKTLLLKELSTRA